jgi:flagellar biosynthetic protein FliP
VNARLRAALGGGLLLALALLPSIAAAQGLTEQGPDVLGEGAVALVAGTEDLPVSAALRLVLILTAMTFLPAVLLVMTPFTRFVIVFALLRQALGLQQAPPNQVLIGLSLFLSLMIMQPMRGFMLQNTRGDDLAAVLAIGNLEEPETLEEIPTPAVVSAFVLSELKTAFVIAIKVYLPFLVIDMVIASLLLGMGMMMLPPVIISLPF